MKYLVLICTGFLGEVNAGGTEFAEAVFKKFATTPPAFEA